MENVETSENKVIPWWERSLTYRNMWRGTLFDRMILKGKDEEEQHIQALRDMLLHRPHGKRGYLSTWRAKLMTESYKQTEGEAPILRKAKAFKHICQHMPLIYSEHQLLLGDPSAHFLGGEVEPEFFTSWLERGVFVEEVNDTMSELDALRIRGIEA